MSLFKQKLITENSRMRAVKNDSIVGRKKLLQFSIDNGLGLINILADIGNALMTPRIPAVLSVHARDNRVAASAVLYFRFINTQ